MNALLEYFTIVDFSIREYQSKELCTMHLSALLQFVVSMTALLGSIDLLSFWYSTPAYYAFFIMLAYLTQAYLQINSLLYPNYTILKILQ